VAASLGCWSADAGMLGERLAARLLPTRAESQWVAAGRGRWSRQCAGWAWGKAFNATPLILCNQTLSAIRGRVNDHELPAVFDYIKPGKCKACSEDVRMRARHADCTRMDVCVS
jgi:hypothetical protein